MLFAKVLLYLSRSYIRLITAILVPEDPLNIFIFESMQQIILCHLKEYFHLDQPISTWSSLGNLYQHGLHVELSAILHVTITARSTCCKAYFSRT
jgi:hypothetical protein